MGRRDRRREEFTPVHRTRHTVWDVYSNGDPAIAPLMLVRSIGFRIFALQTSIKEILGGRIDLRIEFNGNAVIITKNRFNFNPSW